MSSRAGGSSARHESGCLRHFHIRLIVASVTAGPSRKYAVGILADSESATAELMAAHGRQFANDAPTAADVPKNRYGSPRVNAADDSLNDVGINARTTSIRQQVPTLNINDRLALNPPVSGAAARSFAIDVNVTANPTNGRVQLIAIANGSYVHVIQTLNGFIGDADCRTSSAGAWACP